MNLTFLYPFILIKIKNYNPENFLSVVFLLRGSKFKAGTG